MDWRTKTPGIAERHRYDYSYDGLNQLKSAKKMRWIPSCQNNCTEWTNYYEGWSGNYSYDLNGNIQTLNRAGTTYYNDDQLSYTYSGNQIQSITDNASSTYKNNGFVDGVNATEEYLYDANGNMYSDLNKGITDITYNRMNLPEVITFSSGNEIHYLYDAAGSKLQKITYPSSGGQTTTDYSGGFVYTNNTVDFFAFSEGRVRKVSGNWQYEYDLKDHLGNVRATFSNNNGTATLLQADSYYPFGYKMPGLSYQNGAENKFTYNGKELEDEFGLDWYHYGARYYDPAVGRWWSVDPLDEFMSPYIYVGNNPIMLVDPDGMMSDDPPGTCIGLSCMSGEAMSRMFDQASSMLDMNNENGLFANSVGFLSDFSTNAGYLTAATSKIVSSAMYYDKGRIFTTFLRYRPTFSVQFRSTSVQKFVGITGGLGTTFGFLSLASTGVGVSQGYISQSQGIGDGIFGGISMLGWAGSMISTGYFIPKTMYENNIFPFRNSRGRSMYPEEIFGDRTPAESWMLLKKYSWLGDVFDD